MERDTEGVLAEPGLRGHSCVPFLYTVALFSQNPQEFVCVSEPNKRIYTQYLY